MSFLKTISIQHLNATTPAISLTANGGVAFSNTVSIANDLVLGGNTVSPFANAGREIVDLFGSTDSVVVLRNPTGNTYLQRFSTDCYLNNQTGNTFLTTGQSIVFQAGGNDRMRIDSAGRITTPNQPAFFAHLGSEQAITTALTKVNFQNTLYNVGNNYDTTNSRFVAPVTGLYQFNLGLYPYPVIRVEMYLFVNGSVRQRFQPAFNTSSATESNPNGTRASTSFILNTNDYVEIFIESADSGGVWNGGPYSSYFNGYLVG